MHKRMMRKARAHLEREIFFVALLILALISALDYSKRIDQIRATPFVDMTNQSPALCHYDDLGRAYLCEYSVGSALK